MQQRGSYGASSSAVMRFLAVGAVILRSQLLTDDMHMMEYKKNIVHQGRCANTCAMQEL